MSDVMIMGADMIAFGRYPQFKPEQLAAQAALLALDDAGLAIDDVDVVYTGSVFTAQSSLGQKVLQQIGQTGVPCVNVSNACASGATAIREAFVAIRSGLYDVALAIGAEKNPQGMLPASAPEYLPARSFIQSSVGPSIPSSGRSASPRNPVVNVSGRTARSNGPGARSSIRSR